MNKYSLVILLVGLSNCYQKGNKSEVSKDSLTIDQGHPKQLSTGGTFTHCKNLSKDYFKKVKFPNYFLDSLDDNMSSWGTNLLNFTPCDDFIFKNTQPDITHSYISLQDSSDFYIIVGYKQQLGENHVFVCSINKDNELLDYKIEMTPGIDNESRKNVLIDGKIMNRLEGKQKLEFLEHGYTSIYRQYYSLKDPITGNEVIEVGEQQYITYSLNTSGKFIRVEDKSFAKKYTDLKNWY